jgi:hypothetical protein
MRQDRAERLQAAVRPILRTLIDSVEFHEQLAAVLRDELADIERQVLAELDHPE